MSGIVEATLARDPRRCRTRPTTRYCLSLWKAANRVLRLTARSGPWTRGRLAIVLFSRRLHFAAYGAPHYIAKMQRISEILQFPVIVERRRPLSVEPQPLEKFDFLLRQITAE